MIYTCYEMIRDCRDGRPEGWSYFITSYVPIVRRMLLHYAPNQSARLNEILKFIHSQSASLFHSLEPAPERWFIAELRQRVLAAIPFPDPSIPLDLESVAAAFEPLTVVEKQAAWIETMRYSAQETGAMLRMAPATVEKIRGRAADLIRGHVDTWNRDLLGDNGIALGRAAAAAHTEACLSVKVFLDVLDGRMTWDGRQEMERHVTVCWHCVDHFCRMAEVIEILRGIQPLTEAEAAPFHILLGLPTPKSRRRWF